VTRLMVGKLQRWAIAPPALEEGTGELEELPPDTTVSPRGPELDVTFSAQGWANDEMTGRAAPARPTEKVPRRDDAPVEPAEPRDTIPSPPSFGED